MTQKLLMLPYAGITPHLAAPIAHAGAKAAVLGRVTIGPNAWLGPLTVIRADGQYVEVGTDFHLGPRSTLHIAHDVFPCVVGNRVTVGEYACVHACTVGDDVVVEDGAVVLDGAIVEDNVVLDQSATVLPGRRVKSGHLYTGTPAKPSRPLAPDEVAERRRVITTRHQHAEYPVPPQNRPTADSEIDPSVFIASTASVRGRLRAATGSSIWFSNDFDAGDAVISIGQRTNIQDNTIIRCTTPRGVTVGSDSTVGHNVKIHDCIIGSESLIGIGSVVAPGTIVGDRVMLAAKSVTLPDQELESGWLWGGSPPRKLARLDSMRQGMISFIISTYCQYGADFAAAERELVVAGL